MKKNMYSIFDTKAKVYSDPFYTLNDSIARRMFENLVNDPQTDVFKHPNDFQLFLVGEYDDQTGKIDQKNIVHLCSANELQDTERKEHYYKFMSSLSESSKEIKS